MFRNSHRNTSGFTLIELAIVLGVAGVLIGGLWRLMSAGNQQTRDQTAAAQQKQLISAVNAYLQSTTTSAGNTEGAGQTWLSGFTGTKAIVLPTSTSPSGHANCMTAISTSGNQGLCEFLPPGFNSSTVNAYGHSYTIRVKKDTAGAANAYSFMIITTGTEQIPDTSGGRISALIGGDGGFIYSNNVCGTPVASYACGAYGAWTVVPQTTYGLPSASLASGHIASRSYYSSTLAETVPWLARLQIDSPSAPTPPKFNMMTVPLYMGGNNVLFGSSTDLTTLGGGAMYLQGGSIQLGTSGAIIGSSAENVPSPTFITLTGDSDITAAIPLIMLNGTECHASSSAYKTGVTFCTYTLNVNGDATVTGLLYANSFWAGSFYYTSGASVSDERLKDNIQTLADPLADIMKMRPISFTYKENGKKSLGVIAQELEKIYPYLVSENPQGYKGVNYDALVAPLIGAVQELKKENDMLKKQLSIQKESLQKLEKRLHGTQPKEKAAP
ncbi:MAG: tail fiber domain-containing protein [Alphaproteobacteria bacterium]|nr:tail fiber domain-containing protein [Alphaproteobacteria bacterium]